MVPSDQDNSTLPDEGNAQDDDVSEISHPGEPMNKVRRGDELNLTQKDPTMREVMVGVGWDLRAFESNPLDLDVSVFLLGSDGKTRVDEDFIFYNSPTGSDGAVKHMGDSRTGAGDGDDEMVMIDLSALSFDILKVAFVLSIYDMEYEDHNFSMVKNVYFRLVNQNTGHELFRYELDDELTGDEGLLICELERIGAEWHFKAIGDTVPGGLGQIAEDYGIWVAENVRA